MNEAKTSKGRILVADDSPTIVGILQAMLEGEGYEVIPAADGIEAISKAYQETPDLVVLDIFMPKINGYQVCRLLKYDEITSHIPIIMLTGSERGDRFWSLETGADEFRTKDFEFQGLMESIERLLSATGTARASKREVIEVLETSEPADEIQILSKLGYLLDRQLYRSTIERIRLETILDSLGEGVFTIDADKRVVAFNKSLQQMTGLSQQQVSGKKCADVTGLPLCNDCLFDRAMEDVKREDENEEDESPVFGSLALGDPRSDFLALGDPRSSYSAKPRSPFLTSITAETEIDGGGGRKIPVNVYLTLLRDHVSKIVGAVCVLRDITRMKEIERMNDELSKAYSDLKNAQAQLIQSEKMASLGLLVAGAAHELNNPVSFIYSNISHLRSYIQDIKTMLDRYHEVCTSFKTQDSLESRVLSLESLISDIEKLREKLDLDYTLDDLGRLVDDIDEGARRTKGILEDLKAFSRSDEGKTGNTNVNDDIEKSLNLLVDHYKDRIIIHRDYADLPRVKCYIGQISQVFVNLITNACQSIEGEGDIWIATRLENDEVVISIRDNGIGIVEDHIDKIFDPFFTTKDVGEGTGLGLSTTYGIIQRHKGEISVDSQVGSGTIFTIRLPVDFESKWFSA